jgi:hypothetical protein
MERDDPQRWLEQIAGRAPADRPEDRQAYAALRSAVHELDPAQADQVGLQRLMQRLEREGLVDSAQPTPRSRVFGIRVAALAASLVVAVLTLTLVLDPPWRGPVESVQIHEGRFRGPLGPQITMVVTSSDIGRTQSWLLQTLSAQGLEATRDAPDTAWTVTVGPEQGAAMQAVLDRWSVDAAAPARYRFVLEARTHGD